MVEDWQFYSHPIAAMDSSILGGLTGCSIYWSARAVLFHPDFDEYNYFRQ